MKKETKEIIVKVAKWVAACVVTLAGVLLTNKVCQDVDDIINDVESTKRKVDNEYCEESPKKNNYHFALRFFAGTMIGSIFGLATRYLVCKITDQPFIPTKK